MSPFFYRSIQSNFTMREVLPKQRKYMSSKDLYFLPQIKEVRLNARPLLTEQKIPTFKHKSIEEIIEKKDNKPAKLDRLDSFMLLKENKAPVDLYNKYQSLPKIYLHRNRKHDWKGETEGKVFLKKHLKSEDNEETKIEDEISYLKNKQNSFNFNDAYYKEHFNKRLQEETSKLQFKLSYNFSEKQFLGEEIDQEPQLSERKQPALKYTKIELSQEEVDAEIATLERVPDFLMHLLDPQRPLI